MKNCLLRRFAALLAACLMLTALLPAQAEAYPYVAFTTASLRLRRQPADSAETLLTIPAGDAVMITGESGNYYIAAYEGKQGYILKGYLGSASGAAVSAATPAPSAADSVYPLLYSGSQGQAVTALQQALRELGFYTGKVDGSFGTGTRDAVTAFQQANQLTQTGTADGETQALLYAGSPRNSRGKTQKVKTVAPIQGALIQSGSQGEAVSALQTRLKALGYYKGTVDGQCGSGTVSAVKAFQKKAGLSQTGKADAATQAALYAETAPAANATATPRPTATPTPIPTSAPGVTPAPDYPYVTYTLSSVNLRKGPATTATRLATVPKGAEISILAVSGNFLKIAYNGKTGFVMAEFVKIPAQYLPGASLSQDSQAQQNYPYLQSGSSGKHVAVLQEALKELGFYTGAADGNFGASTLAAYKAFQKKNGLKQDGVASPEAQKLIFEGRPLNAKGAKTSVKILPLIDGIEMRLGDRGDAVTKLQQSLAALAHYTGSISGTFDSATQKAVRAFQSAHHMTVDGVAGTKTQQLLFALAATPAPTQALDGQQPLLTPTPTPLTADNVIVMQKGTRGVAVARLQERLKELGYFLGQADGVYDDGEISAVREFQRKNGLKIDGIAGLNTQLALYSAAALPATSATLPTAPPSLLPTAAPQPDKITGVLRFGSSGEMVRLLQERLTVLGYYSTAVDGVFGTGTAQAVTRFQKANGLSADGVVGQKTIDLLYGDAKPAASATQTPQPSAAPAATLLKTGDRGDAVKEMQKKLVALGYLAAADGVYGPRTYNAVVAFQKRNGLTSDGVAGAKTLARLNSGSAIGAAGSAIQAPEITPTPSGDTAFKAPAASEVRYANWYTEIRARARLMPDVVIYDPDTGLHYNLHMFSFGKHADSEPPTAEDTAIMYQVCGENSWTAKYVWVIFSDGRVYIASTHSHGHEVDHTSGNNLVGHICLHFPRVMSEAEATGPYAVSHQKEILWGWELTQAMAK